MKKILLLTIALFTLSGVWAAKTVYLEPNIWAVDDPAYAVYAWGGATDAAFYDVEPVTGTTYFKATIPDDRTGVIFTRAENATKAKNWDERWNQTVDITLPAENSAAYIITGWDGGDGKSTIKYSAKFPNYALIGTASASSGNPALAIDGNTGTRWESAQTDEEWWQVDLGEVKTFNTISIMWEGAYSKSFTIRVSTDGESYTNVVNVEEQTLSGFPYVQNFQFEAKTARYIKFNVVKRGTGYGNSFWEFGVYNLADPLSLASINITVDKTTIPAGGTATFTATGKDQLGGPIATGDLTWESSTPAVGTVDAGVLTGVAAGTTTVTAKKDLIVSNGVDVEVVAGEKIDLLTNYQYRIYNLGEKTKSDSKVGAFDDNDSSVWSLIGNAETAADEASRTYDTGFIADLGNIYDITSISIHFEGACSEVFGLAFAGADGVFGDNVYTGGRTGINNHTEEFSGESVTNARYVKFLSTKAATQWGVKIFDFSVYGIKVSDVVDTEVPTVNATEASKTDNSITLTLTGTDNSSKYLAYEVAANGIAATYFYGPAGANTTAVLTELNGGTTYNFAIYSIDGKGNRSAIKELSVTTTGETFVLTAAPVPTRAAADVKSIYSNAYIAATAYGYGGWGQSTQVATETVEEDNILHLTNYNYLGFEYTTQQDLSDMEYLHIDILPMQAMNFGITPILVDKGSGSGTENSQSVGTLTVKEWNSIDIPLSQFNMDFTQLSHQLKFDKGTGSESVYVDNIYFWKEDANTKTVTFKNSIGWDNVYAYVADADWNAISAAWPGDEITSTLTWSTTSDDVKWIIFNDGTTQTANLTFADGTEYDYGYYVVGSMNSWAKTDGYAMARNTYCTSNVEYKLGRQDLTTTDMFKVALWNGATLATYYPDGMGNSYGENGEITADGTYNIFFRPNADGGDDWYYNYIWVGTVGDLEDLGTDPTTGAQVLDGTWNAEEFATLDSNVKASSYDLTNVTGISSILDVADKTVNPYCMFITSAPGKVNRNEVVWDEANNRYNGYALNFAEPADATAPFDINTSIAPIHVVNPFFQRMFTSANNYFTMTIPFDYTLPATDKAWTMSATSSESGLSVTFTEVAAGSTLTKNTPYLYFSSVGGVTMPTPGEVIIDWAAQTVAETDASFVANYSRKVTDGTENIYVLPGVVKETALQFQKAGEVSIRPFRAYLQAASAPAKINVMFDDATGIHAATAEQLEGIFNIYSIDGKLVRQNGDKMGLNKGVYIINGKKVVVK